MTGTHESKGYSLSQISDQSVLLTVHVTTVSLIGKLSKIGNFESCIWEKKIVFAIGNDS